MRIEDRCRALEGNSIGVRQGGGCVRTPRDFPAAPPINQHPKLHIAGTPKGSDGMPDPWNKRNTDSPLTH